MPVYVSSKLNFQNEKMCFKCNIYQAIWTKPPHVSIGPHVTKVIL